MAQSESPAGPDAKTAPPKPAPLKKPPASEDDDDAALVPRPPLKQKTLPTGLSRAIVIGTVIFALAYSAVGLLSDRYALSPVPNSVNSFVFRIDKLTGHVHFCSAQGCTEVNLDGAK